MAFSNAVLVRNTPANMEVIGPSGSWFDNSNAEEDLAIKLQYFADHPEEVIALRAAAEERVREKYSWERVTDRYELLYNLLLEGKSVPEMAEILEDQIPLEPKPEAHPSTLQTQEAEGVINHG